MMPATDFQLPPLLVFFQMNFNWGFAFDLYGAANVSNVKPLFTFMALLLFIYLGRRHKTQIIIFHFSFYAQGSFDAGL